MTGLPPAVSGELFPRRYLAERLARDADPLEERYVRRQAARLTRWWERVASSCGPATGVRAVFDLAALPLFAALGFRAGDVTFERSVARVQLITPGGDSVALLVLPWASRPSSIWRGACAAARQVGADWCFVVALPFLSILAVGESAPRQSVDFTLPGAFEPACLSTLLTLARATAFDRSDGHHACRLDRLVRAGRQFQDRVRADLQAGVIESLRALTPVIRRGQRAMGPPFEQALTVLYRVLFLLFAESRDLLPHRHPVYHQAYAVETLCREAARTTPAHGLWEALAAVTRLSRAGCHADDLIVRPFNGRLFARAAAPALEARRPARRPTPASTVRDRAIQQTLVALTTRVTAGRREEISYADLGVEQLGAVYERVLDLEPDAFDANRSALPLDARPTSSRPARHSDRRKQSGTFYTPQALAELVVRRTLAPLVAGRSSDEILAIRVVDPAMGSGAFLVAACRYLAAACERALVEEGRLSESDLGPAEQADIRRLIAERCLAGVDLHPIAVQLARLSLWLATLAEGRPLSFLDHRLRVGNSLVGASPDDLRHVGDRPGRRRGTLPLLEDLDLERSLRRMAQPLSELRERRDDTVHDVRAKEALWSNLSGGRSPLAPWCRAADLWCARWFWSADRPGTDADAPPPSAAELRAAIDAVLKGDPTLRGAQLGRWLSRAGAIAAKGRFFHWPLEFPDVFYDDAGRPRERAGFDAVVGNPPWEMLREDGAGRTARAAGSTRAPRGLHHLLVRFIRESGLYPSCRRGHVNLYQPFLERALSLVRPGGRVGLLLPWGLAVDDGAAALRARLLDSSTTESIDGFDNALGIFPIHRGLRFLALVTSPGAPTREIRTRFGVKTQEEIAALSADAAGRPASGRPLQLSPETIRRVGGPSRRIPDIRRSSDLELLEHLTSRHPRLGDEAGWNARFGRELNVTDDRAHFGARGMPVLEGKHLQPFVASVSSARFRIEPAAVERLLGSGAGAQARLAYRDVSGVSNRLSLIAAIVPAGVVTSHTLHCLKTPLPPLQQQFLCGVFNSFVLNAAVRMLMGGHLTTTLIESLPVPIWTGEAPQRLIARLAERLSGRPFARRTQARLQGAVAHLYGLAPGAFRSVLAGFPLVPAADRDLAYAAYAGADESGSG